MDILDDMGVSKLSAKVFKKWTTLNLYDIRLLIWFLQSKSIVFSTCFTTQMLKLHVFGLLEKHISPQNNIFLLFMSETVQDTIWYFGFQMPCSVDFQHFIREFIDSLIIKSSPPSTNLATLTPNLEISFPLNLRSPWTVLAYCICISYSVFTPSSLASVMVRLYLSSAPLWLFLIGRSGLH